MEIVSTIIANIIERVSVFSKIEAANNRAFQVLDTCKSLDLKLTFAFSPPIHVQEAAYWPFQCIRAPFPETVQLWKVWNPLRVQHHGKSAEDLASTHFRRLAWQGCRQRKRIRLRWRGLEDRTREDHNRQIPEGNWLHWLGNPWETLYQVPDWRERAQLRLRNWQHCWSCCNQEHDYWPNSWSPR